MIVNTEILSYIASNPWKTSFQIATGMNMDKTKLRAAIKQLIANGNVQKQGKAKGTRYALSSESSSIASQVESHPSNVVEIVEYISSAADAGCSMKELSAKFGASSTLLPLLKCEATKGSIVIRGKVRWTRYYSPTAAPPEKTPNSIKNKAPKIVGRPRKTTPKTKKSKTIGFEGVNQSAQLDWENDKWFDGAPEKIPTPQVQLSPEKIFQKAYDKLVPGKKFDPYQFGVKLATNYNICSTRINDLIFGDSQTREGGALRDGRLEYEMSCELNGNRMMAWKPEGIPV